MHDLDATRDADQQALTFTRQFDVDDGCDPWADWDDIGGEG
jgi:hypothetical protein